MSLYIKDWQLQSERHTTEIKKLLKSNGDLQFERVTLALTLLNFK